MIENESAVLAEGWTGTLPAHVFERVLLEPEFFGSLGRGEKLLSSPVGHGVSRLNGIGQKLRENKTDRECRTGIESGDTPCQ